MKTITLNHGNFVIVDDRDFDLLNQFKWHAKKTRNTFYVARTVRDPKVRTLLMHREITLATGKSQVDHVNGNGLDNRRENLRLCSTSENMQNRSANKNNSSGFKGVSFHKGTGKWQAVIGKDKKLRYLGVFSSRETAAEAYANAARSLHGQFAKI